VGSGSHQQVRERDARGLDAHAYDARASEWFGEVCRVELSA